MADYVFLPVETNTIERVVTAKAEGHVAVTIEHLESGTIFTEDPPQVVVLAPYN